MTTFTSRVRLSLFLRSRVKFAVLPVVLLGIFLGQPLLDAGLPTWANATQAAVQPIAVCGPLLAAFAAWDAADFGRKSSRNRLRLANRGGVAAIASVWLASAAWAFLAFTLWVALFLVAQTGAEPWGDITWSWVVSSACAVLAQASAGCALGFVWPTFLAPAATAMLIFFVNATVMLVPVLPNQTLLSAAFSQVQEVAFSINNSILWAQAVWFVGIATVLFSLALWRLNASVRTKIGTLITGSAAAAVGLTLIVASPNGFFEYNHSGWDYTCSAITKICLHPAYNPKRAQIEAALEPTLRHLEQTTFSASRYEWTNRGLLGEPRAGAIAFHLDSLSPGWQQAIRLELSRDILTAGSSSGGPCDSSSGDSDPGAFSGLKSIVAAWLADTPEAALPTGTQEISAMNRFQKLSERDKQSWLSAHTTAICNSTLNSDDF